MHLAKTFRRSVAAVGRPFEAETRGNIAIMFAVSFAGVAGLIGAAMDYSRYSTLRKALQAATDQSVIMAAVVDRTKMDMQTAAEAAFATNWKSKERGTTASIVVTEPNTGEISGTATAKLPTTFLKILGIPNIDIKSIASVAVGQNKAEVALALDVTGSMAGTKLNDLKSAAKLLVDTAYQPSGADQRVRFSLVPFSNYVNVGTVYKNASWMSVPAETSTTTNVCSTYSTVASKTNCVTKTATAYNDGVPYTYTYEQCDYTYGPPTTTCSDVTTTTTWYGCAGSRTYPKNTQKVADSSSPVPGVMNVGCSTPLMRLTNSQSDIKSAIDALVATGDTYIPSGLIWGWRTLANTSPFSDGEATSGKVRKVLVLMTDGANTLSPSYPAHDGTDTVKTDTLMGEICKNVKDDGIAIYAIAFDVTDNNIKDRLKSCATTLTHYFDASSSSELSSAFEKIGRQLSAIHLKQ